MLEESARILQTNRAAAAAAAAAAANRCQIYQATYFCLVDGVMLFQRIYYGPGCSSSKALASLSSTTEASGSDTEVSTVFLPAAGSRPFLLSVFLPENFIRISTRG
jgi:hypothetical protein